MLNSKKIKFVFLVVLIIGILIVVNATGMRNISVETLQETIASFGAYGFIVYSLIYIIGTLIFFPGTPLTITSGLLFGPYWGTVITVISATLGASGAFFLARILGKDFVDGLLHEKFRKLEKYDDTLATRGFVTTLILRLLPIVPFNGLNFAMGLTRVSFKDYFFATLFGIIPGAFVLANIRGQFTDFNNPLLYAFIALFVLLAFLPKITRRFNLGQHLYK